MKALEELPSAYRENVLAELETCRVTGRSPEKWHDVYLDEHDIRPMVRYVRRAWMEWDRDRRKRRRVTKRQRIIDRDGMVCGICGLDIEDRADLHIDHIMPVSRGGTSDPANLQPSHAVCNLRKGARA